MMNLETGDKKQTPVNEIVNARRGVHTMNGGFIWKAKGERRKVKDESQNEEEDVKIVIFVKTRHRRAT